VKGKYREEKGRGRREGRRKGRRKGREGKKEWIGWGMGGYRGITRCFGDLN